MELIKAAVDNENTAEKHNKKSVVVLRQIGELLYGQHWKRLLAEDLDLDPRRIPQWIAKDFPVPPGIWNDLEAVIERNESNIGKAKRILHDIIN